VRLAERCHQYFHIGVYCTEGMLCLFSTWSIFKSCAENGYICSSTLHSFASRIMFDSVCSMHSTITWFIQFCIGIFFAVVLDVWCFVLNQRKSIYHKSMTYIANYIACHNQGCKTIGSAEAHGSVAMRQDDPCMFTAQGLKIDCLR
jgi:hypothetical protein